MQGVYAVGNFQPSEDRSRSRPPLPTLREPPLSSLPNVSQSAIGNSHPGQCDWLVDLHHSGSDTSADSAVFVATKQNMQTHQLLV